jgi:uncharacterized protein YqeY
MNLKEQLNNDLKEAMKGREKVKTNTLRNLRAAMRYAEIDSGVELDDAGVLDVIAKQAKQHRDSITEYSKAGRTDLVDEEAAELVILEHYLPAQLSEVEIKEKAQAIINQLGVTDMKGVGLVMKQLMVDLKGQADGKVVSQVVRQLLTR